MNIREVKVRRAVPALALVLALTAAGWGEKGTLPSDKTPEAAQSAQLQAEFERLLPQNEPERCAEILARLEKLDPVAWKRCQRLQKEAGKTGQASAKVLELQREFETLVNKDEPERRARILAELEKLDPVTWERCMRLQVEASKAKPATGQVAILQQEFERLLTQNEPERSAQILAELKQLDPVVGERCGRLWNEQKGRLCQQKLEAAMARGDDAAAAALLADLEKLGLPADQTAPARQKFEQYRRDFGISMSPKLAEARPRLAIRPAAATPGASDLVAGVSRAVGVRPNSEGTTDYVLTLSLPTLKQLDAAGEFYRYEAVATAQLVRSADGKALGGSDFRFDKSRALGAEASQAAAVAGVRDQAVAWFKTQEGEAKGGIRCFELEFHLGAKADARFKEVQAGVMKLPNLLSCEPLWQDPERRHCRMRLAWLKERCPADPMAAVLAIPELAAVKGP